ncbi:MAG TPA: TonB-dependent receptor [Opitutus sp.]|nr:TonB-dependent receptor [Opitutus sp.]
MKCRVCFLIVLVATVRAQTVDVVLPGLSVYSPRVANQAPVATFAMPVSALRFEPLVDIQARNFAEGQADVTIRGGIFENSGFKLGASTLYDPQTGHYFAEIPVAPVMLTVPRVLTGADNAAATTNATVGTVAYGWRPVRTAGMAAVGAGQYDLLEGEFYQGGVSDATVRGRRLGADVAWAHSDANGSVANGDHVLNRVNARVQLAGKDSQTDLFAGYQEKFFGWPNLYTPFNSNESENLHTLLVALNHRADLGGGDYVDVSAYHRRNVDDYEFARTSATHPYHHTTWVEDAAIEGRREVGGVAVNFRAEVLADELHSNALTFGPYHTRTLTKLALVPEESWALDDGARLVVKAGATYDDSNRTDGALAPTLEIARERSGSGLARIYASYAETTQLPTYTALDSNPNAGLFRGNPNLGRETSRNVEVGAKAAFAGWDGQAALFYRRDDDLVDWTFKQGVVARTANAVNIATTGLEVVARRSWSACDFVLGYTWLTKDADYRGAAVDASFYALNYARQRLTAAVIVRLTPQLTLRWDNEARVQAANLLRTVGGDRAIISSLGVALRPMGLRHLEIAVQADNLWNSDFQEIPAVPAARRQVSGRVSYAW